MVDAFSYSIRQAKAVIVIGYEYIITLVILALVGRLDQFDLLL